MRIDKFLNCVNITKRRAVSDDMCKKGVVSINDVVAKSSKEVKVGDEIKISYLDKVVVYEVLSIPTTKNTPKSQQNEYIKVLKNE